MLRTHVHRCLCASVSRAAAPGSVAGGKELSWFIYPLGFLRRCQLCRGVSLETNPAGNCGERGGRRPVSSSWSAAVALLLPGSRGPGHSSWCSSWLRPGLGTRCPRPPRALRDLQGREFLLRRKLLNLRSSFTHFHFLFQQLQARRLPQSPAHGALRAHVGKKAQPGGVVCVV